MITLALAQMMYFVALRMKFTGGEDGIQAVPRGMLFGLFDLRNEMTMYVFVLAVFLCGMLLIHRIINSPFGEVLKAIRENETRAISLGYKTDRYKLLAFVSVGDACRSRRLDQGNPAADRLAHRRELAHVGRSRADVAGRWARDDLWAGGRLLCHPRHAI